VLTTTPFTEENKEEKVGYCGGLDRCILYTVSCLYLCLRCCVSVSLPNFRRIKIYIKGEGKSKKGEEDGRRCEIE